MKNNGPYAEIIVIYIRKPTGFSLFYTVRI